MCGIVEGMMWNEMKCPKCGESVEGEDLGDHPAFLTFDCECGHSWSEFVELPDIYNKGD